MSKLKRFNKSNKKNIIPLVALCLVVAVISATISYAVYQKTDEVLFINARVGEFETSSSDIELAMTLDGNDIDTPPSKGNYNITIECDHADGVWESTDDKWGAYIYNISSNRVKCNVNFETLNTLPLSIVELGDYINMTPTNTSYTPPSELTGCMNDSNCTQNTINPSELNLWRVISKNEDGTVDVVSVYLSSVDVYFYGKTGYMNLVGGLNEIAAQYTNSKYVQSTRHMGYSNQILKCTSISSCPQDTGYEADINLVQKATGKIAAGNLSGKGKYYWLAARIFQDENQLIGRCVHYGGWVTKTEVVLFNGNDVAGGEPVRPILTLKSSVGIESGSGTSSSPYQLG